MARSRVSLVLSAVTVVVVGAAVVLFLPRESPPGVQVVHPYVAWPLGDRSVAELFAASCAACHGEQGKGDGPSAPLLDPPPRNFLTQPLRYAATGGTREQILAALERTIARGLLHSGMPGFQAVMSPSEIAALAKFVLASGGDNNIVTPAGSELQVPQPPQFTPGLVERGREVYMANICASCHGVSGQADGAGAPGLTDFDGNPIKPAQLNSPYHKAGTDPRDLYRAIVAGVPGTPMAAYRPMVARRRPDGTADDRDAWALVALIDSFSPPSPPLSDPAMSPRFHMNEAAATDPAASTWFDLRPIRVALHQAHYTPGLPQSVELRAAWVGDKVVIRISGDGLPLDRARVIAADYRVVGAPAIALPDPLPEGHRIFQTGAVAHSAVLATGPGVGEERLAIQVVFDTPDPADARFTGWVALWGP